MLGYESGLLAIKTAEKDPSFEQPISATLKNETVISPRGEIGIDAHNETTFDSISVKKSKDNLPISLEKYSTNDTLFADANFENTNNSEVFGGWYNPYLCT